MKGFLLFSLLLTLASAVAQLQEYRATDNPRAAENIAQPCGYQAMFPAGDRPVKVAWVTYDREPDIAHFYTDPDVLAFAKRNDLAMVLATQCPARHSSEKGQMDMYPEHGMGRSLFSALNTIGREGGHPELANAKLIVLGFSGTSAYFGHFVAYAPERVLAAILANPGADDPDNVDRIRLDENSIAVPLLIIVGGVDTISGTAKPYKFFDRYRTKGAPWVYLVQNKIPHCCINDTKSFMLDWLQEVIQARHPDPQKPLWPMNSNTGWYGSIQPCKSVYDDHWDCLCGISAMPTLNMLRRRYHQTNCHRGSFLLSHLRTNG